MKRDREIKGFGPFRSFGWKKNLLAVGAGLLIYILLEASFTVTSEIRVISEFDASAAILPFIGFVLGIWGAIGAFLGACVVCILTVAKTDFVFYIPLSYFVIIAIGQFLYSIMPATLWYALPLKGEKRTYYPRMDTSAHVIKYYLIMALSVLVYVAISSYGSGFEPGTTSFFFYAASFAQYFNVVLILGIPVIILASLFWHRTLTINERMVLAFLLVGVIASALGAYLLYRNTTYLKPDMFDIYDAMVAGESADWTEAEWDVFENTLEYWNRYFVMLAIMLNGMLIIEMLFMRSIERKVTRPILKLADVLEQYTIDQKDGRLNSEVVTDSLKPYRYGYGEVSGLTRTCVEMVGDIDTYTENLKEVTAEKQRIGTELDVASKIQRDMLPGIFPPFPDRNEVEIYASMTPAKEVGGDFYDFYFVDCDHLVLTIADVSGKGVPASLFMVISKTLLKNHAHTGGSPKEILTYVNHQLYQNNDSYMFCTVWLGILELSTGKLVCANAGHEYPILKRAGGRYELIRDKHNAPLGIRDGIRYSEYELTLNPGDCLFEYTDGVTEATDASEKLFGEERLVQALNIDPDAAPEDAIREIYDSIHHFVREAPQFDDITMLCIKYKGSDMEKNTNQVRITVPARVDSLDRITGFIEEQLDGVMCPMKTVLAITLAVEEIFVNIASYAYEGKEGDAEVIFSFDEDERMVRIEFEDKGIPFDPTTRPEPDITQKPSERQIGGLGIHLVRKTMDGMEYRYEGGKNVLVIQKKI
ncbi:MAG: SpoIIE family protein phosphatase [Blautia sp.]|nr:SpoIIE family protein phosphatase [Blautia sp.]